MSISIIIPTYNEEKIIASSLKIIKERAFRPGELQIIIADGGSDDQTLSNARKGGADKIIQVSQTRRSIQMNEGARAASGEILYFLHADTHPPLHFDKLISRHLHDGYRAGCFQLSFGSNHPVLTFYGWCTRFNIDTFRFGDQSLFVDADTFWQIGGFKSHFFVLEDQDIVKRLKRKGDFVIGKHKVVSSERKYLKQGVFRLQLINAMLVILYKMGLAQPALHRLYQMLIH